MSEIKMFFLMNSNQYFMHKSLLKKLVEVKSIMKIFLNN